MRERLPFGNNLRTLKESRHRLVTIVSPEYIAKIPKAEGDRTVFSNLNTALEEIKQNDDSRTKIQELLYSLGASSNIVTPTQTVLHVSPLGEGITYSEIQRWHKDALPVGTLGMKIFDLPLSSLRDIKALFHVNILLLTEEKTCFEFDGSADASQPSTIEKLLHNLFPLLYSHNVLILPDNSVKLVDVESLEKFSQFTKNGIKGWLKRQVRHVGCKISLSLLNIAIFVKKLNTKNYS